MKPLLLLVACAATAAPAPASLPGCYSDDLLLPNGTRTRQLPHRACFIHGPLANDCAHLSQELCGHLCKQAGFPIAGVEASHECTCGYNLAVPSASRPASECDEACTGNKNEGKNETCGGSYRLWAFNSSSFGPPQPIPGPTPLPPTPPPSPQIPPNPFYRPIFHTPADNAPGYVGDANGMMFRRVPWHSHTDAAGLFHLFWQAEFVHGLWWGHGVSKDYVHWHTLPYNTSVGPGAESGGATQLPNGDIVTVFTDTGRGGALDPFGAGHLTARPVDIDDPLLEHWHLTNKVAGPLGSDLNAGWCGNDGRYRIVASCGAYQTEIPYGEMCEA